MTIMWWILEWIESHAIGSENLLIVLFVAFHIIGCLACALHVRRVSDLNLSILPRGFRWKFYSPAFSQRHGAKLSSHWNISGAAGCEYRN